MDKLLLQEIVNNTEGKGLVQKLQHKYKELYDEIVLFQKQYNTKTLSESIYWIINNLIKKPDCPKLFEKCSNDLYFINLKEGYKNCCGPCALHKKALSPSNPMFRPEIRKQLGENSNNKFKNSGRIEEICSQRNFVLLTEYKNAHSEVTLKCIRCGSTKTLKWNHFQQYEIKCCN